MARITILPIRGSRYAPISTTLHYLHPVTNLPDDAMQEILTHPGRLSLQTPEVVSAAAASEIKTGRRVGLGWDMTKLEHSQFGRQKCGHTIIPLMVPGGPGLGACFDDSYAMNPRKWPYSTCLVFNCVPKSKF